MEERIDISISHSSSIVSLRDSILTSNGFALRDSIKADEVKIIRVSKPIRLKTKLAIPNPFPASFVAILEFHLVHSLTTPGELIKVTDEGFNPPYHL